MPRIALYVRDLQAGGVPRTMLNLAFGLLQSGFAVDFVVNSDDGDYRDQVPPGVRTVVLAHDLQSRSPARRWRALCAAAPAYVQGAASLPFSWAARRPPIPRLNDVAALAGYLGDERPAAVIAAQTPCNLAAVWARRMAAIPSRLVLIEPVTFSKSTAKRKWHAVRRAVHSAYPLADAIVAVSTGAADDLALTARLPRHRIATIYNPVVMPNLAELAAAPPPHPWLAQGDGSPVVVAAGRLDAQKNFTLLLDAFARVRLKRPARLLIFGEGSKRGQLEAHTRALGIEADVALPGFIDNPLCAFSYAALFVLSSDQEGLPGVLIEALACGCPVVATNCPSGPSEILDGGRFGELVPVGDADALAAAMERTLNCPLPAQLLRARGAEFSLASSVNQYLTLLGLQPQGAQPQETLETRPHRSTNRC